ncbi:MULTISPECIES: hypothetical protein [Flavobacterium]|uniref:hypothetical protein n=1 Tax=Flavobacterium TaxID=237 RepID=UPI003390A671
MKQIIKLVIVSFLIISCNGQNNKKVEVKKMTNKVDNLEQNINFLDKKYQNGYALNIDGSSLSEHPIMNYLDCKKEGLFTLHFVPREDSLSFFWTNEYLKKYKYEYDDTETENKNISNLLHNNLKLYNIFSYTVKKEYLAGNPCSLEAVYLKSNTIAEIYFFDQNNKVWKKLRDVKSQTLPVYHDNNYFSNLFPDLFSFENSNKTNYLGTKFKTDRTKIKEDLYHSKNLDNLFNLSGATYSQGKTYINIDYKYQLETINIIDIRTNEIKDVYILSKKDEVLCDTLKINKSLIIDTNIIIKKDNNRKAFCLRTAKNNELSAIYILDKNNKLLKMPINTKIESAAIIDLDDRD